jgi:uncharacterized membrane protein
MKALMIKDLSTSVELDRAAMTAVHGGTADQANGTSQSNGQVMQAVANIGNGSLFGGVANISSDNTFSQSASNESYADNFKGFSIGGYGFPFVAIPA